MATDGHFRVSVTLNWRRWFPPDVELDLDLQLMRRRAWSLARLPERLLRRTSSFLTLAWLLLTVSLLLPVGASAPRVFWAMALPLIVLLLVVSGHELWRRICPLALLARLPQHLWPWGLGRSPGQLRRLDRSSWLARHHLGVQALLLLLGLALRLLLVNNHALSLALLFVVTIAAAMVCGALLPGKAWCQYLCPMGPVEAILTGPRGLFGSRPHRGSAGSLSQSTCRTPAGDDGRESNACVHCQSPCIDIDSEQTYWQSLRPGDGLSRLSWMYPGLVLAFFLVLGHLGDDTLAGLRNGIWSRPADAPALLLQPLPPGLLPPQLNGPRLLTVPLLLLGGSLASGGVLGLLHRLGLSRHRSRLLATALAVPVFFWCVDPSLGLAGPVGSWLLRGIALASLVLWLRREWRRGLRHHSRERVLHSLGQQLHRHLPPLLSGSPAGPRRHAGLPAVLAWMTLQEPSLRRQLQAPLLRGLLNDLRRQPHLDHHSLVLDLLAVHRALGLRAPDPHELLARLVRRPQS